ncbi:MAG: alpha-L-rhamnosidase C-terminal domain-containing protein, partial [Bacteroidaceae bacterium]
SQTANAFALHFGLVDKKDKERVLQNLINDIRQRGNALTAGDIGYRYVLRTLEENDRQDVIFDMNSRYDVPGYGYQLAHGATSLTESWNALRGLSNNHFMLGHLMEWLYGGLGGIRQQENSVAFNKILITPQIVGDITYANTSYESPYGQICCDWKLNGDVYTLKVSIPANSEAIICLPTKDIDGITDYGRPVTEIKALKMIENKNGKINLHAGSGKYLLKMKIENSSI